MSQILLVEDDPVLARGLSVSLELEGYQVRWAASLKAAFALGPLNSHSLVILDLGLPDGSGLELCTAMRAERIEVPVLVLTAQVDEDTAVKALNAGANDYVRKPFGQRELLARVRSLLRPMEGGRESGRELRFEDVVVLDDQRKVFVANQEIALNRREYDIFRYLVRRAGSVVTREAILDVIDKESEISDRAVDSHLSHIRARLRRAGVSSIQIRSVYGVGYALEKA